MSSMHGIVSLLDEQHHTLVEGLWAELAVRFGLCGVYASRFPHFSYQVAAHYDLTMVEGILEHVAAREAPFSVQTTGLGIFTGAQPVLFVPVVRSLELCELHRRLWGMLSRAGKDINVYYHPDLWMPHITIGLGDLDKERLSDVMLLLSERSFNWTITINNLTLMHDTGTQQELRTRCNFCA